MTSILLTPRETTPAKATTTTSKMKVFRMESSNASATRSIGFKEVTFLQPDKPAGRILEASSVVVNREMSLLNVFVKTLWEIARVTFAPRELQKNINAARSVTSVHES
jgi:hypothetical protein